MRTDNVYLTTVALYKSLNSDYARTFVPYASLTFNRLFPALLWMLVNWILVKAEEYELKSHGVTHIKPKEQIQ